MMSVVNRLLPKRASTRIYLAIAIVVLLSFATFMTIRAVNQNDANNQTSQTVRDIKAQTTLLDGQWSYLPGSTRQKDGLLIKNTGLAIVEQDGSGGQANPPINLYGSHLEEAEQFTIAPTVSQLTGSASIQLYGETPIIADEFRIERKSVRITLAEDTFTARLWDGSSQDPVIAKTWKYTKADKYAVSIRHQANTLAFSINGHYLGTIESRGVFDSKHVWFGMDASDSWLLTGLTAKPLDNGKLQIVDSSTLKVASLADGMQLLVNQKRSNMTFGAAMALGPIVSDPEYAHVALGDTFGSMTTENALKWQFVHPKPDTYTFQEGDALVALAQRHNMKVHGHALVFGEANPTWVKNMPTDSQQQKDAVKQVMNDHIKTVVGHYKGKIATWDVVNEPLADYDSYDENGVVLRNHKWHQAMGEGYIAEAFRTARAADPNAKLFINDYGLEEDGERWVNFFTLISRLKSQGVPIDGVGFQSHVYDRDDRINTTTLRQHMQQLARIGVDSRVSENDVYSEDGQTTQAQQYADTFAACLNEPTCISYTTWGVTDRYNTFRDDDGSIQYGQDFLWSDEMKPTPAVDSLRSLLK